MKFYEFPEHDHLFITHNGHKGNYESMEEYLIEMDRYKDMSKEEYEKCISTNQIWEIQLYPTSPISFYWVAASTLQEAIRLINAATSQEK